MTIRIRVLPRFPALISGTNGLRVDRDGVDLVVKPDYGALVQVPSVIDPDTNFFAVWNEDEDMYVRMSFGDVFDAVSGLGFMQTEVYDPLGVAADAFDYANMHGTNTPSDGTVTTAKLANGALSADATGRGKMADGFVNAAKLADGALSADTTGRAKMADGYLTSAKFASATLTDLKWLSKGIGEFYVADDNVAGVDIPPTSSSLYRYVELTSGLTGSGQYNENCLASESVSGSAPLVLATAVVSLSGSPMNGQTIRLLNTERRMLRAGSAGTLQNDALQNVTGTLTGPQESFSGTGAFTTGAAGGANRPNNGTASTATANFSLASDSNARTDTETRMKNIGVRIFRRIK